MMTTATALKNTTAPAAAGHNNGPAMSPSKPMTPAMRHEMKDSAAEIRKDFKTMERQGKAFNDLVTATAIKCLKHAEKYGDATLLQELFQHLPKSFNAQGLRFWIQENSPVRLSGDAKNVSVAKEGTKDFKPFNLKEAEHTPFYDMPEVKAVQNRNLAPFSALTLIGMAESFITKVENAARSDNERPFDQTYGNPKELEKDINELVMPSVKQWRERAEARHAKRAKAEGGKDKVTATRLRQSVAGTPRKNTTRPAAEAKQAAAG